MNEFRPDRWILAWSVQTRSRMTGAASFPLTTHQVDENTITVPTRSGPMSALAYLSRGIAPLSGDERSRPPLHIQFHGGGMIGRAVREDEHVSRYLASETGAIVLTPHFRAAPQVTFPTTEQDCFDVLQWARANADRYGWDSERITVGGAGTGAKLALNVAQQAYETRMGLAGLILTTPVTDVSRPNRNPIVEQQGDDDQDGFLHRLYAKIVTFTADAYFPDPESRIQPLASPAYDLALVKKMPPVFIQTGSDDLLKDDGENLAKRLNKARKPFLLTEYEAGHSLTVHGSNEVVQQALNDQVEFLLDLYR